MTPIPSSKEHTSRCQQQSSVSQAQLQRRLVTKRPSFQLAIWQRAHEQGEEEAFQPQRTDAEHALGAAAAPGTGGAAASVSRVSGIL